MENKFCSRVHIYKDYKNFMGFNDCDLNLDCPRCWADKAIQKAEDNIKKHHQEHLNNLGKYLEDGNDNRDTKRIPETL